MKIISMKQFREKFDPIKNGLIRGEEYLLLYRSKPLAVISPYRQQQGEEKFNELPKPVTISVHQPDYFQKPITEKSKSPKPIIQKTEYHPPPFSYQPSQPSYQPSDLNTKFPVNKVKIQPTQKMSSSQPAENKTVNKSAFARFGLKNVLDPK